MTAVLDLFPSRAAGPFGRRLKHARGARIPVTIVTGFLGAGKTTLVRHFLETPEGRGTAVVVNEFGAVGIDDALVRGSTDEVTFWAAPVLHDPLRRSRCAAWCERETGMLPRFGRVLSKPAGSRSGDSEPSRPTGYRRGIFVEVVVTVVDANCGLPLDGRRSASRILADRLVISRPISLAEHRAADLA